ncbi:DNA-binding protein [Flavobacterium alvei]|uniref:DNA-binding protein n=1 Tax=Flavobacterium alvei TaxID=2080416 RepID=A0A2S5A8I9_9FLAO|nr:HIRAN domain-containing protein [Flavobacterium alvei]POY38875.1 DNA-binding protein [Flavobacterium alvei]HQF48357.1 HIRAN domain-containing protein [Flavobacterium alvei]
MREHLAHFDIAGFTYYEGVLAFNELKIGVQLQLKLEEENKYDARAVAIYYNEFKLGFVPRSENRIIYKLLKVGIDCLEVRIQRVDKKENPENQIGVVIHLVITEKETQE